MTSGNGTGKPVTLALAGCGRISQVHLHAIANEPRVKLVAVVDTDENAAYKAAAAAQVEPYLTMEKMLAGVGPEAVVICTPPNTHRALAEQALAAGAHVLCEKPLTTSRQDAEKLAEAASMSPRILMIASKFRYVEDIAQTKGILDSGILGDV